MISKSVTKVIDSQPKNLGGEGEAKYIVEANKLELDRIIVNKITMREINIGNETENLHGKKMFSK